jgi:hypothetical protein
MFERVKNVMRFFLQHVSVGLIGFAAVVCPLSVFADVSFVPASYPAFGFTQAKKITVQCKSESCDELSVLVDDLKVADSTDCFDLLKLLSESVQRPYHLTRSNAEELWETRISKPRAVGDVGASLVIGLSSPFIAIIDTVVTIGNVGRNVRYRRLIRTLGDIDFSSGQTIVLPAQTFDDFAFALSNQ